MTDIKVIMYKEHTFRGLFLLLRSHEDFVCLDINTIVFQLYLIWTKLGHIDLSEVSVSNKLVFGPFNPTTFSFFTRLSLYLLYTYDIRLTLIHWTPVCSIRLLADTWSMYTYFLHLCFDKSYWRFKISHIISRMFA